MPSSSCSTWLAEQIAMLKLARRDTKTLLAVHGWSGILLGLLLYAVICTGMAAVFAAEINDWSSPLPRAQCETSVRGSTALTTSPWWWMTRGDR